MLAPKYTVREILLLPPGTNLDTVYAWVRTFRNNQFISISDGTSHENLQVVVPQGKFSDELIKKIHSGACIKTSGILVESPAKGQRVELVADSLEIVGNCSPEEYPLQPKKHSLEFLREIGHLRMRTQTFGAVFRLRNMAAFAIHKFFQERGFLYIHTPIITASDAEGAGEMFRVTTLNLEDIPKNSNGSVDYLQDFFHRPANLTVSGQLEGELAAMAFSKIYTFGPTFRAENSNTTRHLAEFWMIEPEMAFYDLEDNMNLAEEMLKYVIRECISNHLADLEFLNKRWEEEEKQKPAAERFPMNLLQRLQFVTENPFTRISYTQAIEILQQSAENKKKKFKFPVDQWGFDLQSEHERYLVEKYFQKPVILTDYPKDIKAFYMRQNEDGKTVRAMDILFPGIGEIVGGSQREERYDLLLSRMQQLRVPEKELWWYLDTRRFGSCPHSGFGLGFERLMQFITGMGNIRDVIPFPRFPGHVEF